MCGIDNGYCKERRSENLKKIQDAHRALWKFQDLALHLTWWMGVGSTIGVAIGKAIREPLSWAPLFAIGSYALFAFSCWLLMRALFLSHRKSSEAEIQKIVALNAEVDEMEKSLSELK
jgi:hypothetical protein